MTESPSPPWSPERPAPPKIANAADERATLESFLDYYRAALVDRAWGLSHQQMQQQLAPSDLSLAGLINHMAMVERNWFQVRFAGEDMPDPWVSLDWEADRDAEMTAARALSIEQLLAQSHDRRIRPSLRARRPDSPSHRR